MKLQCAEPWNTTLTTPCCALPGYFIPVVKGNHLTKITITKTDVLKKVHIGPILITVCSSINPYLTLKCNCWDLLKSHGVRFVTESCGQRYFCSYGIYNFRRRILTFAAGNLLKMTLNLTLKNYASSGCDAFLDEVYLE